MPLFFPTQKFVIYVFLKDRVTLKSIGDLENDKKVLQNYKYVVFTSIHILCAWGLAVTQRASSAAAS